MRKATEMKSNIVVLTSNPEQQAKLRNKLQEYGARAAAVTATPEKDPDSIYKFRILSALIEKALIDPGELERDFVRYPWFDYQVFWNAMNVIIAYNADKLDALRPNSGTGLK